MGESATGEWPETGVIASSGFQPTTSRADTMIHRLAGFGLVLLCLTTLNSAARSQDVVQFARLPDVSPDGKRVAFSYLGDIWIVSAKGGTARLVTLHKAHDTAPVFSPDGQWLAFSSKRYGNYDIFIVSVQGGRPRRLTFDSADDMVNAWSPDGRFILFTSQRETSYPPVKNLYRIPSSGGRARKVSAFEGRDGVIRPDGGAIAYVRGPGLWYRKGYRGSANDDLWLCDADGRNNRRLTATPVQDGSPMWSADGKTLYYVTEQFGTANICRMPVTGGKPTQVTFHQQERVRRARISRNGKVIVYECGPDLWVWEPTADASPHRLRILAAADDKDNPDQVKVYSSRGITEYALSPDERYVAFVIRGEIFVMPIGGGTVRRLTRSPAHDRDLAWSRDMKKLLFVSDRDGCPNIYVVEHNDPRHPSLTQAHRFKVRRLTSSDVPISGVSFSPDGRKIAFLKSGQLWTMKPDGRGAKVLVQTPRVIEYAWSPDSKWIMYSRIDPRFASELYLIPADGGKPRNATRYATRNFGISWSRDGRRVAFISERRKDLDVFVMILQGSSRRNLLSRRLSIDFNDLHLRVVRSTPLSSNESEVALKPDGSMVAFRSNALNGDDLWLATITGSRITRITTGKLKPRQIRWTRSGRIYFLDGNGSLRHVTPPRTTSSASTASSVALGQVSFTVKLRVNREEEFAQMFAEGWRKLWYNFYDPSHHGADWLAVRTRYQPMVRHVAMKEDFFDWMRLMLGELNASHLGISSSLGTPEEYTAGFGCLWDDGYPGPGLRIAEVVDRTPAARAGLRPGQFVMAIEGVELRSSTNVSQLLNDKSGQTLAVVVADDPTPKGKRRLIEIKPIERRKLVAYLYRRWVTNNARRVDKLSGGKLGYIHIPRMDSTSLDNFVRALYSDHFDKEGIVLDVRYNGGGFTHDQILSYLGGKDHTYFITREGQKGTVLRAADRKWNRPLVLLCNNRSYSDAEIFPSAFRTLGLGKLVGTPTGGFVIGTVNEKLIDGTLFRVPRLGVFTASGVNMEKTGVVPDVVVEQHPDELARGYDAQLDRAVEVLLADVEEWKQRSSRRDVAGAATPKPDSPKASDETKRPPK